MNQWQETAANPPATTAESSIDSQSVAPNIPIVQPQADITTLVQNALAAQQQLPIAGPSMFDQSQVFTTTNFVPIPLITTAASELSEPMGQNDGNLRLLASLAASRAQQQDQLMHVLAATTIGASGLQTSGGVFTSPAQTIGDLNAPVDPMLLAAWIAAQQQRQQQELAHQQQLMAALQQVQQNQQLGQLLVAARRQQEVMNVAQQPTQLPPGRLQDSTIDMLQHLQVRSQLASLTEAARQATETSGVPMEVGESIPVTQPATSFPLNLAALTQQLSSSTAVAQAPAASMITTTTDMSALSQPVRRGPGRPRRSTENSGGSAIRPRASTLTSSSGSNIDEQPQHLRTSTRPQLPISSPSKIARPVGRIPSSADSCNAIANFLMLFNKVVNNDSDADFSRKAVESLIKKLKDRHTELDALIRVVNAEGGEVGECITIPRTLDGRLQVAGRKGFPHVVYARVFRWPDLHKNEIKHTNVCTAAFDMKGDSVCVNPYHYQRITPTAGVELSPILSAQQQIPMIGQKRSIGAEDFRRLLLGAATAVTTTGGSLLTAGPSGIVTQSSTGVPPDPAHHPSNARGALDECPPAAKSIKTCEETLLNPFDCAQTGDFLVALQREQQKREQPMVSQSEVPISVPPVFPSLALLQSALQRHQQHQFEEALATAKAIAASATHGNIGIPVCSGLNLLETHSSPAAIHQEAPTTVSPFFEVRRAAHDSVRVLRERLQLDMNEKTSDSSKEEAEFSLGDFCKSFPLSAAAFMELLSDLTHNPKINETALKNALAEIYNSPRRELQLPAVLGNFISPRSAEERKLMLSPASSIASPRLPAVETLQSIRDFVHDLNVQLAGRRADCLAPLVDLIEIAEKESVMDAMQTMLSATHPPTRYDKYSTPDKPIFQPELEQTAADCTCSFKYFEFGKQVGSVFHTRHPVVSIGRALPAIKPEFFDHFDLGKEVRDAAELDEATQQTLYQFRHRIGQGFFVECNRDGEVYVKSLSRGRLFLESHYLDREASVMPQDRLHCVYPNHVLKVFDLRQAFDMMGFWITHQSRALQSGFNFMEPETFISQMRSLCLVRCSFSVSWKNDQFPTFKSAPCTIEFYVNRALRLLDELLRNPRKAHFYLRTGRLPIERPTSVDMDEQSDKPVGSSAMSGKSAFVPSTTISLFDPPLKATPPALATLDTSVLLKPIPLMFGRTFSPSVMDTSVGDRMSSVN